MIYYSYKPVLFDSDVVVLEIFLVIMGARAVSSKVKAPTPELIPPRLPSPGYASALASAIAAIPRN